MRSLFTLLFVASSYAIMAQSYHPFPESGAYWIETHWQKNLHPANPSGYSIYDCVTPIYFAGDTTLNGLTYNKLYSRSICEVKAIPWMNHVATEYNPEALYALIRQDTAARKVYRYIPDLQTDTLLYDFNMSLGSTYPHTVGNICSDPNYNCEMKVVAINDSLMADNRVHRIYVLAMDYGTGMLSDSGFVSVIEGIGSTYGLLGAMTPTFFEGGTALNCFSSDSVVLYTDGMTGCDVTVGIKKQAVQPVFSLHPNPVSDIVNIALSGFDGNVRASICNALGEEVYAKILGSSTEQISIGHLSEGVYFLRLDTGEGAVTRKIVKY